MPAVDNIYIYRDNALDPAAPTLVLSGGTYVGISEAIAYGQLIEVNHSYRVCEGPYSISNPGVQKTCSAIRSSQDDPPRPESDFN